MTLAIAAQPIGVARAVEPDHGRIFTGLRVASPLLGRDIPYSLYLPPASLVVDTARLPVLYLLHGRDDDERAWLEKGNLASTLDRMIVGGAIGPLAVVMPMAANSWYVDDVRGNRGFGAFATALADDFVPAVEHRHHLAVCRESRAIGGLSMGGYGAVLQALTYPERYSAAFSLSGSLFSDRDEEIASRTAFYNRAMPGIFGEPFDAARFKRWTVFARLATAPQATAGLRFWLAAGDRDFPGIIAGTARLHLELRQRSIETHLRIVDGEHDWRLWSRAIEPALAWLSLRSGCPGAP